MDRRRATLPLLLTAFAILLAHCSAETVDLSSTPVVDNGVSSGHSTGTDAGTPEREAESLTSQTRKARAGAEQFSFQAETTRLMDILIHSLYSNKDIFLRELISNASDALDKIRFLSLTDKAILGEGDDAKLEILIHLDKINNVLYLRDRGLGMTKDDLVKNLGTIAKSGTSGFLEQMQKGGDMNLIGQFGVGFYSVYLVADFVEVISKNNDDIQHIWASGADGSFTVEEDTENEPLGRGTLIKIHLKEEAQEYADEAKLKALVEMYSEFINFPIYLLSETEVDVPIEEAEEEEEAAGEDDKEEEGDDDEVKDEEEEEAKPAATRKEKKSEWGLLNDNKAIWLRSSSDVTDEEYQKFYKAISKDFGDALTWSHFKAEGDIEFKSIIFIPKEAPTQFYEKYYDTKTAGLKLYVRRVFISEEVERLLPRYLAFIRGLVDSDTLPINVSREMLQEHAALKTIRKKLVRKILDLIRKMADDERKCKEAEDKTTEKDEDEGEAPSEAECSKYGDFWKAFGRSIKLGVMEDSTNRNRLSKLLRFHTSKSTDKLASLDDYLGRMKKGQEQIYFLAGNSVDEMSSSPFVEKLLAKGYEVIYWTDVLDEYVMQHLQEYEGKKFANASKEGLKLSDSDEAKDAKKAKETAAGFAALTKWWGKVLKADKVDTVKVSTRLSSTPCVVVSAKHGQSANMERITKAQAFGKKEAIPFAPPEPGKIFEINPRHPLIIALQARVAADPASEQTKSLAKLLYETALLESGFVPENVKVFSQRVYDVVKTQVGIKGSVEMEAEEELPEPADEVEEPEEKEEAAPLQPPPAADDKTDDL